MRDNVPMYGHFTIQAIDANNNIIDEWSDRNMIMEGARTTMAEIFAALDNNKFVNQLRLGTLGHVGSSIITPKGTEQGFVKERTHLFSEYTTYSVNDVAPIIRLNDCIKVNNNYYVFLQKDKANYIITDTNLADSTQWEDIGTTKPYVYKIGFQMTGQNNVPTGTPATNIVEDDSGADSSVTVLQSGSTVTFSFDIANGAANSQNGGSSIFTEACLMANDRIFAMKTFKAKVKDSTVLLRIIWAISF